MESAGVWRGVLTHAGQKNGSTDAMQAQGRVC